MFEGLFGQSGAATAPAKGGMFSDLFSKPAAQPAAQTPLQQVYQTKTLSPSIGGGALNVVPGQPNKVVNTGHSTYGGETAEKGMQRDDIVPVGLGGSNSSKENIRMEKLATSNATETDPIEKQAINDYKSGKLSLGEARLKVLTAKQQQTGLSPKPSETEQPGGTGMFGNFLDTITKTITSPFQTLHNEIKTTETPEQTAAARSAQDTEFQQGLQSQFSKDVSDAGAVFTKGLKYVRASSDLLSIPLAAQMGSLDTKFQKSENNDSVTTPGIPIPGTSMMVPAVIESLNMAKRMATDDSINPSHDVEVAAQRYLQAAKVGKYGGNKPSIKDVAVLSFLGFADIMGDPAYHVPITKSFEALKEFATWKQVGEVTKPLAEGKTLVNPISREILIGENTKMKIVPNENEVVFKGYIKRNPSEITTKVIDQAPQNATDFAKAASEATGMDVVAEVRGNDLVMKVNKEVKPLEMTPFKALHAEVTTIPEENKLITNNTQTEVQNETKLGNTEQTSKSEAQSINEKPIVKHIIQDKLLNETQNNNLANVLSELKVAEAGKRIPIPPEAEANYGSPENSYRTLRQASTFPQWVPDELRKKSLFDVVYDHLVNNTIPKKVDEIRLYNKIAERIGLVEPSTKQGVEYAMPQFKRDERLDEVKVSGQQAIKQAKEIQNRLKLSNIDNQLIDTIIDDTGGEAFAVSIGNKNLYTNTVPEFTGLHETIHTIHRNVDKIKLFTDQGITKAKLDAELKKLGTDDIREILAEKGEFNAKYKTKIKSNSIIQRFINAIKEFLKRAFSTKNSSVVDDFLQTVSEGKATDETIIPTSKSPLDITEKGGKRTVNFSKGDQPNFSLLPKEESSLSQEAKKYKSAEEFVKAQQSKESPNVLSQLSSDNRGVFNPGLMYTDIRDYVKDSSFGELIKKTNETLYPARQLDTAAQEIFSKWIKAKIASREIANQKFNELTGKLPKGIENLVKYQAGEEIPHAKEVKEIFQKLYNEANFRQGRDLPFRENYLPQIYKNSPEEIQQSMARFLKDSGVDEFDIQNYLSGNELPKEVSNRLKINPFFSKERVFPDYASAMKYGLEPKYKDFAQLVAHYSEELEKTVANKNLLDSFIKSGQVVGVENVGEGFKALELPFSPKGYYAEPKLSKLLNGLFRDENNLGLGATLAKKVGGLSKTMQEIVLSAGVPNTSVNFYTIGQAIKNLTAGDINGFTSLVRSNFNEATIKYFKDNQETIRRMADEGIDLGSRIGNYKKIYDGWKDVKSISEGIGYAWHKWFNEKTFASYVPQTYIGTFKNAEQRALAQGMSPDVAQKVAGDVTKAFYGIMENVGRSKTAEDTMSALFFAPKFREGVANTLLNTLKSVTTEIKNPAFYLNRRLFAGMVTLYAGYTMLNKKLTGHYMWDNPTGKEFDLQIPLPNGQYAYVGFMPSFLSFARNIASGTIALAKGDFKTAIQKFGGNLSMPFQVMSSLVANKDYFGRPIYNDLDSTGIKLKKMAEYVGVSVNHPFISETWNVIQGKEPLYQGISKMMELPIKYGSQSSIDSQELYKALQSKTQEEYTAKQTFIPTYQKIQQLISEGKEDEAQKVVDSLSDSDYAKYKSMKNSDKAKQTRTNENQMYKVYQNVHQLLDSGNEEEAKRIVDGLSDEDYKAYQIVKKRLEK